MLEMNDLSAAQRRRVSWLVDADTWPGLTEDPMVNYYVDEALVPEYGVDWSELEAVVQELYEREVKAENLDLSWP